MDDRQAIAWRVAQDLPQGGIVNLGRGLPADVANHIPCGRGVMLHSENGLLGFGPAPAAQDADISITNANKTPVTLMPGASIFDLAESFDMIRGGHIDLVLLGGFQVSRNGDLANWATEADGTLPPAVGGAMDLATACREVWVLMTHIDRTGACKLVDRCDYPLTASAVVNRVYTDFGIFRPAGTGFQVLEISPGLAMEEIEAITGAPLLEYGAAAPLRMPGSIR